jgi:hypothetical protein
MKSRPEKIYLLARSERRISKVHTGIDKQGFPRHVPRGIRQEENG